MPEKVFYEILTYKIALIFTEETESSEKPNVSRDFSGEGDTGKQQ